MKAPSIEVTKEEGVQKSDNSSFSLLTTFFFPLVPIVLEISQLEVSQ